MFCVNCGLELPDDARFCSRCGTLVANGGGSGYRDEFMGASVSEPSVATMGEHVSAAADRSRKRIPIVLLIVLVALAVATTAFAAWALWTYVTNSGPHESAAQGVTEDSGMRGEWVGEFYENAGGSFDCRAGELADVSIEIASLDVTDDQETIHVSGTFTGIAHLHANIEGDVNGALGDLDLDEVPFSCDLTKRFADPFFIPPEWWRARVTLYEVPMGTVSLYLGLDPAKPDQFHVTVLTEYGDYGQVWLDRYVMKRRA